MGRQVGRQVGRGIVSSGLPLCDGGERSIVAR